MQQLVRRTGAGFLLGGFVFPFLLAYAEGSGRDTGEVVGEIKDRQAHVLRLVRDQLKGISSSAPALENELELHLSKVWSNDSVPLGSWVISLLARGYPPGEVLSRLKELSRKQARSPVMKASLARWEATLSRWSQDSALSAWPVSPLLDEPPALMKQGRRLYLEALGYVKVGRQYDALVLDFWSVSTLSRFIERFPNSEQVPEALFMMGDSLLRLRQTLPGGSGGRVLLQAVVDLYPDTIWAKRAASTRKSELGDAS